MLYQEYNLADMHTHSENSHDSICKIEDMCMAQTEKGTKIFAVTDHFDTDSYKDYDVFAPIENAAKKVEKLNQIHKDSCLILAGVEISEGFWHPQVLKKVTEMIDYDVIIGSVHLVRYKDLNYAYSKIDFSKLDIDTVYKYLDAYFNDVLTMIDTVNFDILAHLTCPLRYIKGKYNIDIDLSRYDKKIDKILKLIIQKEIALEINTSSYDVLNDFMPPAFIIKKYYDMGGRLLTLGSDAHIAERASKAFDKAVDTIKEIGFDSIFYYKKRCPVQIKI